MPNRIKDRSQPSTVSFATQMSSAVTLLPTKYGLTTLQAVALADALTAYNSAIAAEEAAKAAHKVKTVEKQNAKAILTNALAKFAKIAYAYPAITNAALTELGLEIPSAPHTITPARPSNVQAFPDQGGTVKLTWERSGNPSGVMYSVQTSTDNQTWVSAAVTRALKFTLTGCVPGVQQWFRVVATTGGVSSQPSIPIVVYAGPQAPVELKVAA